METKLFSVFPMTQQISVEAGGTYTGSITIAIPNSATEDFSYSVSVTPFSVHGENYEADLSSSAPRTEIADWITIENPTGVVSPNETVKINYTIHVPETAAPGGQYASLLVGSKEDNTASSNSTNISNILQLASIIYADVSGEVVRDGSILNNEVPDFSFSSTLNLTTLIENRGNTHRDAVIDVTISNPLTGEIIFPNDKTSNGHFSEIIMPESTRFVSHEINNLPLLGVVKVNQTVYFNDIVSVTEKELLICPLWFIFLVVFSISLIITSIVMRFKKRRRKTAIF